MDQEVTADLWMTEVRILNFLNSFSASLDSSSSNPIGYCCCDAQTCASSLEDLSSECDGSLCNTHFTVNISPCEILGACSIKTGIDQRSPKNITITEYMPFIFVLPERVRACAIIYFIELFFYVIASYIR